MRFTLMEFPHETNRERVVNEMSNTRNILRLIAESPMTVEELAAECKVTHTQAQRALYVLLARGHTTAQPARYSATAAGVEIVSAPKKTSPEELKLRREQYAARTTAKQARRGRHPLETAWGARS